jgi:excisionase family DNA binding protein
MHPSTIQAFDASQGSSQVQPDAGKQRFLAVSLLYTERTDGEVPERAFSPREVAEALGVVPEAVRELCRCGVLEHFRIVNAIRIPRSEVERFVQENFSLRRARHVTVHLGSPNGTSKRSSARGRRSRTGAE